MTEKKSCSYGNKQLIIFLKQVNRKTQGVAQSQSAANLRHQEEEKNGQKQTNKQTCKANKQMHEQHIDHSPTPSSPSEVVENKQAIKPIYQDTCRVIYSFVH